MTNGCITAHSKSRESFEEVGAWKVQYAKVINLLLKEMAETFLFLRSQFISGRWNVFMMNVICQNIKGLS